MLRFLRSTARLTPHCMRVHAHTRELRLEFGLPRWTVPIIGVIQAAVAVGNFHDGGQWQFVAQKILATLMGGCVFAHVVQAGKTKNAMAPVVLLIFSVLLPILAETEPWEVVVPVGPHAPRAPDCQSGGALMRLHCNRCAFAAR